MSAPLRLALCAALWIAAGAGCTQPAEDRDRANAAAASVTIATGLTVRVEGGAVVATTPAQGDQPAAVRVRAQSLDVRVEILDSGCAPRTVALTVTHLPATVNASWRPLIDAVPLEVEAARAASGGALDFVGDPHDRDRTPLGRTRTFTPTEGSAADIRRWWVTTDRGRLAVTVDEAPPVARADAAGACVTGDTALTGPLGAAAVVARFRVQAERPQGGFRFAVWGNNAGQPDVRARLMASVNAAAPLFAIISGDLTADGEPGHIRDAVAQLDDGLQMPWFATVGDRDVLLGATSVLVEQLGRSTFAFDVGDTRLIVLDSGDKALGPAGHTQLSAWLGDTPLWWGGDDAPPTRLVITHVPPFDPYGSRGNGFNQRLEAARVIAALKRAGVPFLLTSQLATYTTRADAGVTVVHGGGGGAPLEDGGDHFWLQVSVGDGCQPPGAEGSASGDACGGCVGGEWCTPAGACAPCLQVERVDVPAQ